MLHGGGQERGKRSGSENVAGAGALATVLRLVDEERAAVALRISELRDAFIATVLSDAPSSPGIRYIACLAPRRSFFQAQAVRPCCSNSKSTTSSARAGRPVRPAATSRPTC